MNDLLRLSWIAGVLFLGVLSPGPNFALVTSTAMTVSRRAGLLTGLGLAAASCTWTLLAVVGIGLVLTRFPAIAVTVRTTGAIYLVWIGIRMIARAGKPIPDANHAERSGTAATGLAATGLAATGVAAAGKAYLVSMTNPKAIAFYGSIFTVMVPVSAPRWFDAAIVLIAALVSASWYCGLALLFSLAATRRVFARGRTAIEAVMGVVLIGLGGRLLFSR